MNKVDAICKRCTHEFEVELLTAKGKVINMEPRSCPQCGNYKIIVRIPVRNPEEWVGVSGTNG